MSLILAILFLSHLTNLLDLVESFEQAVSLIVVEWVRRPSYFAARFIVQTTMYRPILALADAVVVLDKLIVRALANYSDVLVRIVAVLF